MRNLIIYYSYSGKTGLVVDTMKKELNSHIMGISDFNDHKTLLEYMFPTVIDSAITNHYVIHTDYYDTIFIGTPVWFGSITPAIHKVIKDLDLKGKNVILFNTMKIAGADHAIKRAKKAVEKQGANVIAAFTINTNTNRSNIIQSTINTINELKQKNILTS